MEQTKLTPPARVAQLIDRLSRLTRELQFCAGLNPAQWEALRFVSRANRYSSTPTGLAEFLGTTKGTASQTVIALEAKGYVQRIRASADRRQVTLSLTPAGAALLDQDPFSEIEEAASSLDEDAVGSLVRGLSNLLYRLQTKHGIREFGVCADCALFCVDRGPSAQDPECGMTGDSINPRESGQICANFKRLDAAARTRV
jgi:DNA-binding MarR family transcriptional regulator